MDAKTPYLMEVDDLRVSFATSAGRLHAIDGVNLGVRRGETVGLVGESGSGKSTITQKLAPRLRKRNRSVEILDGDEVRENLSKGLGFSREDRDINIRRIG